MDNFETLLLHAKSEREVEVIKALKDKQPRGELAAWLGITRRRVDQIVQQVRERAALQGYAPKHDMDRTVPEPLYVEGVSTYYNKDGERSGQWVKSKLDKDQRLRKILEVAEMALSDYDPLPKIKTPKIDTKSQICVYPMGDPHIGMYAWRNEAGEDFDCDIAERNLLAAMQYLISKTPATETAVILNLGDFFHSDSKTNRTARSGNALDVDGRWTRVLLTGINLMIECVNLALQKHKRVIVKNNIGNHDEHTSQVLSIAMMQAFKNNKRVEIANPADPFFVYEFGNNLLFSTHSDMVRPNKIPEMVANYYAEAWGRCEHRWALLGHYHHEDRKEQGGIITEIFNTLATSDAWHHASGFRSKRNMKAIVLDIDCGEIERYTYALKREPLFVNS